MVRQMDRHSKHYMAILMVIAGHTKLVSEKCICTLYYNDTILSIYFIEQGDTSMIIFQWMINHMEVDSSNNSTYVSH